MQKKEATQSIAVSADEKVAIEVLAIAARLKPATFARQIFYRGLSQYLEDRETYPAVRDDEIYQALAKLIDDDPTLARIKEVVEMKKGLERSPRDLPGSEQGQRVPYSKPEGGVKRGAPKGQKKRAKA
jgi:hypothetical protein